MFIFIRTENKTTTHYTRDALVKVRISILDKKWRDFMAQPLSQMSLFEGASLISQWATMGHGKEQTCVRDLEISIEDITERVEQLAFEMGYVSGTTDPKKEAGKILDLIKEVMFDEMRFSRLRFPFEHTIHYTCIAQVCLRYFIFFYTKALLNGSNGSMIKAQYNQISPPPLFTL